MMHSDEKAVCRLGSLPTECIDISYTHMKIITSYFVVNQKEKTCAGQKVVLN